MLYFKVKTKYDNTTLTRIDKRNNKPMYYGFLVGNELYTIKEIEHMKKYGVCGLYDIKFDLVEIPKNKTYFLFGARFEIK